MRLRFLSLMLWSVMVKEMRQAFRDKRMAALLLVMPMMQLVVLGYAVDLDVDHIPTIVCDQDHTPSSREILASTLAEGTFREVGAVEDPSEAIALVTRGDAAAAWIVPRGFEMDLSRQRPASIQVLLDGTDSNRAQIASAAAQQMATVRSVDMAVERLSRAGASQRRAVGAARVSPVARILYNPRLRSATYMVPGLAATVVLIVTTIVTAMGIAREKEMGTMEQLLVTPLRPWVLLLGKCLPFAGVGMIEVASILAVGTWLFDVPIRGSLVVVFAAAAAYLMSTLGAGVFISTISASQQQAILGGFLFLMPAILLSGFMTPIENMPSWIRVITYANPVRYFVEVLRGVMLKRAGFGDLATQFAALACFGAVILSVSALRFKKRIA